MHTTEKDLEQVILSFDGLKHLYYKERDLGDDLWSLLTKIKDKLLNGQLSGCGPVIAEISLAIGIFDAVMNDGSEEDALLGDLESIVKKIKERQELGKQQQQTGTLDGVWGDLFPMLRNPANYKTQETKNDLDPEGNRSDQPVTTDPSPEHANVPSSD